MNERYGVSDEELAYIGGTISQTPDTVRDIFNCSEDLLIYTDKLMAVSSSFILAMTKWPEVQRRAQEEIDRVVGRIRFPAFFDREQLPYTGALVKEVCRWRPVAPLSNIFI